MVGHIRNWVESPLSEISDELYDERYSETIKRDMNDSARYMKIYGIDNTTPEAVADLVIETDTKSPEEIAEIILDKVDDIIRARG